MGLFQQVPGNGAGRFEVICFGFHPKKRLRALFLCLVSIHKTSNFWGFPYNRIENIYSYIYS
jgi:hypothetical protein